MSQPIGNNDGKPTHEEIAKRAREIYERSGRVPGRDLENWLEAESQLVASSRTDREQKPTPVDPRSATRVLSKPAQRA
jgi:Protein of unknown function (DUF2934)